MNTQEIFIVEIVMLLSVFILGFIAGALVDRYYIGIIKPRRKHERMSNDLCREPRGIRKVQAKPAR